jgi:radical SAM superfamily enzyme YgiQ (UPF0313 family)
MADILLINPPLTQKELFARGSEATATINPPLGLAYIAAALEAEGHHVEIIDGIATCLPLESVARRAGDFDFIGITVLSSFFKRCVELIAEIRKVSNVPIIAGGAHTTVMPASILSAGADFAILGEGEETIRELIGVLLGKTKTDISSVKGIAFMKGGELIRTGKRELIRDLDEIPMPARHLLPMGRYKTSESRAHRNPSHALVVSRGCPGTCTFCSKALFGTKFRCHSPQRIFDEMCVLRDRYGAKEIAFFDDGFTSDKKTLMTLCGMLIERRFGLPWSCEARVDSVDEEMLAIMKKSGCEFIAYGIESGSEEVIKSVNKKITIDMVRRAVSLTKKAGIAMRGYFMLGFIGETKEQMRRTIDFACELDLDIASFTLLVPLPGTVDYVRAKRDNSYFDPEFYRTILLSEFNFPDKPVYVPAGMSAEELLEIHKEAYRRFYFRPSFLIKQLIALRDIQGAMRLLRGGVTLLKGALKKRQ